MNSFKYDHVILLAHGSPDSIWKEPFEALQQSVESKYGKGRTSLAYMQLTEPSLSNAVLSLNIRVGKIAVLPVFLAVGKHLRIDVPAQIKLLETSELQIELLKPVGDSPVLKEAMLNIIADQLGED